MARPQLAFRDPKLEGLRVVIAGCGRSGIAAARLAAQRGARVLLTDDRDESDLADACRKSNEFGTELVSGGMKPELLADCDLLVVSPGVPLDVPLVQRARAMEIPVWGEVELAARHCRGRIVAITGSNGKSTVTSLVGAILQASGKNCRTGGNLDIPFSDLLDDGSTDLIYALELSSFQLETLSSLRPEVAVVLNVSPDHLDRYESYRAYTEAKAHLLTLQEPGAAAVINADDTEFEQFERAARGRLHSFSVRRVVERGAYVQDGNLVLATDHGVETILPRADFPLPGDHNTSNALAAALATRLVGCHPREIADGMRRFRSLPHRLELVATLNGISFFNDSKATNPASAARALSSFEPGRVHLILGGKDKGSDWDELVASIRCGVKQILLVGDAAEFLAHRLAGTAPIQSCGTIRNAVVQAMTTARQGDVVLLSPGCASFDQYHNFEKRGEDFRAIVGELAPDGDADA